MKKINTKGCKEDGFALSFLPITNLLQKKEVRKNFNIEQVEKGNRYHYYCSEQDYLRFKDFVKLMKITHKKNKRRQYNQKTNEFNYHNLRFQQDRKY